MLTDRKIQKYLLISALLVISVTCLFLSAWNSYIRNSGNNILPVIFFCISLFLILYLVYTFLFYSEKPPEQDGRNESVTGQNKDDQQENKETQYLTADDIAQRIIQKTIKGHNKGKKLLQQLAAGFDAMQAILFTYNPGTSRFEVNTSYAITNEATPQPFIPGEGLHGQAVLEKKVVQLSDLPENFRIVSSGLGKTHCRFLYLLPVLHDDKVIALLEFSTLKDIGVTGISVLNILMKKLGDELNPLITGSDEK